MRALGISPISRTPQCQRRFGQCPSLRTAHGLRDRPKPGRPPALTGAEQATLLNAVFRGPDRARDGCGDWTLPPLCGWIEGRLGKRLHPAKACQDLTDLRTTLPPLEAPFCAERGDNGFALTIMADAD
jgi:hypothetical protein